jgi:hypothetical protein
MKPLFSNFILCILALAVFAVNLGGCAKEENKPLYNTTVSEKDAKPIEFMVRSRIEPTVVKTEIFRRLIRQIFGWIPVVGELLELPMNLINALLPDLPFSEMSQFPQGTSIADPQVLGQLESVEIFGLYLFVTPKNLRSEKDQNRKCHLFFKCKDQDLAFMKEVRVYLQRKDNDKDMVLLARGVKEVNLSPDHQLMNVVPVPGVNLKDYLRKLDQYQVKTIVEGRIPRNDLYIEGNIVLKIRLK